MRAPLVAPAVRVAIVDDHAMVADGLKTLLSGHSDIEVVGTAATVAETLELVDRTHPDVLLLDYRLPDGDGASATSEVLRRSPSTRVVMLSAVGGDELLARSIEAGCSGFLPKDRSGEEVVQAVRAAARGESLVPTDVLVGLVDRLKRAPKGKHGDLTPRELEILGMLSKGMSTEGISSSLFLSEHTVRNHVRNILGKLGAHSKLEAVAVAARDGIISLQRQA
ncbi:MAG: response regulator transcription factor [Acidimicrobiales bacterium]